MTTLSLPDPAIRPLQSGRDMSRTPSGTDDGSGTGQRQGQSNKGNSNNGVSDEGEGGEVVGGHGL